MTRSRTFCQLIVTAMIFGLIAGVADILIYSQLFKLKYGGMGISCLASLLILLFGRMELKLGKWAWIPALIVMAISGVLTMPPTHLRLGLQSIALIALILVAMAIFWPRGWRWVMTPKT